MRSIGALCLLLHCLSVVEARTFTSSDGIRKIEASVTAFDENLKVVSIIREDGMSFNCKLSSFCSEDQAYVKLWSKGRNEDFLYVGREYPGHLNALLQILNEGGISYGQPYLRRSGQYPIIIGNGSSPFLAWVNGYNQMSRTSSGVSLRVNFDLVNNNWRSTIRMGAVRSVTRSPSLEIMPSANAYGLQSVGGPILYQPGRKIVVVGSNPDPNSVIVLPRTSAPVYVNPMNSGMRLRGSGISNGGFSGSNRTFVNGAGISLRVRR